MAVIGEYYHPLIVTPPACERGRVLFGTENACSHAFTKKEPHRLFRRKPLTVAALGPEEPLQHSIDGLGRPCPRHGIELQGMTIPNNFNFLVPDIQSNNYLSLTSQGNAWVRKALHPAEKTIKAPRCPSHGNRPTAAQESVQTFVIESPDSESETTWDCGIYLKNDPLCPITVVSTLSDSEVTEVNVCTNQAFGGSYGSFGGLSLADVLHKFQESCEQYRMTSLSITGHFTGPALQAQGSVLAAQMSDPTSTFAISYDSNPSSAVPRVSRLLKVWGQTLPGPSMLVAGTNVYTTAAKEGFYMPMKFENPSEWHSSDDTVCLLRHDGNLSHDITHDLSALASSSQSYPSGNVNSSALPYDWLAPVDNNLGVIWLKGLAKSTSFRITVHIGLEMMTRPGSTFATFCEAPAPPDPHAIAMYYEISSRMADCYPARDNENSTLWDKIKAIAKSVWSVASPILAATPLKPVADIVNGAAGVYSLVDGYISQKQAQKNAQALAREKKKAAKAAAKSTNSRVRALRKKMDRKARNLASKQMIKEAVLLTGQPMPLE